eukprot:1148278-Pelagomonas_calceolata.AAC.2
MAKDEDKKVIFEQTAACSNGGLTSRGTHQLAGLQQGQGLQLVHLHCVQRAGGTSLEQMQARSLWTCEQTGLAHPCHQHKTRVHAGHCKLCLLLWLAKRERLEPTEGCGGGAR